ncbi:CapA family protein [Candidatus Merdisoma sp. JLR.KK006]|uniref:CapA family protein n=1 Tax=Candidatus Merdisoma sp. JLR.KK006 TaxID=3112626 RepID=UPI002FF114AA
MGDLKGYEIFRDDLDNKISAPTCILIGGDFVPTISNKELFERGDIEGLMGKLLADKLLEADLRIFNLEVPITNAEVKLPKAGSPNLKTYEESISIFNYLKPLILSGANNHIFDYKEDGIKSTKKILYENDIKNVGFGLSSVDAKKPFFYNINGVKIGVYACAENEFCCATEKRGGSNGYDPLNSFDDVRTSSNDCDYQIVLFHGGRENYRYPSPQLKKICNKFVDCGADLVVCQHSHCIGCYENYKQGCIIYGQGNFLFDYNDREEWQTGILVEILFCNNTKQVRVYPIQKENNKIAFVREDKLKNEIIDGFIERTENIKEDDFLKKEYISFSKQQSDILLLRGIMGINNRLILGLNKVLRNRILRCLFQMKRNRRLLNYLRCESIRESILLLLKEE